MHEIYKNECEIQSKSNPDLSSPQLHRTNIMKSRYFVFKPGKIIFITNSKGFVQRKTFKNNFCALAIAEIELENF